MFTAVMVCYQHDIRFQVYYAGNFSPQGIANKYPDFKSDHALVLLLMRGDLTRTEARQVCRGLISHNPKHKLSAPPSW